MKLFWFFIFIVITSIANAVEISQPDNVSLKLDNKPEPEHLLSQNTDVLTLLQNQNYMNTLLPSMYDIAQKTCTYKIKPQTVTVSVGFLSFTWDTVKLCNTYKNTKEKSSKE